MHEDSSAQCFTSLQDTIEFMVNKDKDKGRKQSVGNINGQKIR